MVQTPVPNRGDHEIDLVELMLKMVSTLRTNFWLIVVFFVVGTGLGVAYFMATKKEFVNKMIISSSILTTSYAKVLFDNVNTHLRENDYEVLARDFHVDAAIVKQISAMKIENLTEQESGELKESDRYLITVNVYDQSILPKLQQGIIDYLESNEFVRVRIDQQRNTLTQMLAVVEKELADIQLFKAEIYSGRFFSNAKGNVMFDPTTVNNKILDLTQKRIEYKNSLELINSVQLIEGFTAFRNHKTPSLAVSIAAGSMIGLFAVGGLIAFKSVRRVLRMAEAQQAKNAA